MRLIMAMSADGFVARSADDDMRWTSPWDKTAFRLLTGVGRWPLAVGSRTAEILPDLAGRHLFVLSTRNGDGQLGDYYGKYPDGWLIGGQTVARAAVDLGVVDEFHLCVNSAVRLGSGIELDPALIVGPLEMMTRLGDDVQVRVHRR